MKSDIMANMSRSIHKVGFKLKKYSPEILVVTGVVGIVASTVRACKATTKVQEIIDETNSFIMTYQAGDGFLYFEGKSYYNIATLFNEEKVLGRTNWKDTGILRIIANEVYKGDYVHGKRTKHPTYYEDVVEC